MMILKKEHLNFKETTKKKTKASSSSTIRSSPKLSKEREVAPPNSAPKGLLNTTPTTTTNSFKCRTPSSATFSLRTLKETFASTSSMAPAPKAKDALTVMR